MAKIYLIRHAESIANTKGIYQGQTYDTELSPLGKKQALALGKRFASIPLDAIYTSPLKRAVQTALEIQHHNRHTGRLSLESDLLETNHGKWEGKTRQQIEALWPDLYRRWLTDPEDVRFPEGEHIRETAKRVVAWMISLFKTSGTCAVVTHSNAIQIILCSLVRSDLIRSDLFQISNFWQVPIPQPTAVTEIISHSPIRVICVNDVAHLKSLASDLSIHAI